MGRKLVKERKTQRWTHRDRKCAEKLNRGSFHADTSFDSEPMVSNEPRHSMARWSTAPHTLPTHTVSFPSPYQKHTHRDTHTLTATALWERS